MIAGPLFSLNQCQDIDIDWWTAKLQSEIYQGKQIQFLSGIFSVLNLKKAYENGYQYACKVINNGLIMVLDDTENPLPIPERALDYH